MKKFLALSIVLMLAVPAMGYAGSATSRWDLTIGGMVKVDVSYADQSSNQDLKLAERESGPAATSSRDKYGARAGELVKPGSTFPSRGLTRGAPRPLPSSNLISGACRQMP